jgi:hypothetical protein
MYHRVGSACEKADPAHRKSQDWSFNGPDGRLRPARDKSPSRQGQGLCRSRHARKAQRFLSTVSISRCKAIRTAFTWAGACLTKSSRGCASIGKKSSARCFRRCDFHPRRRYGARFHPQGSGWHGWHQCPDPGATRLYTFGGWKRSAFGDLNQHGPDAVRFYTKTKTASCRWPSGVKEGASFVIPMMT